jgi:hypothetical protein
MCSIMWWIRTSNPPTYSDSYLPINYSNPFYYCIDNNINALMTIYKNNGDFDNSNVIVNDNNIIYDKKYLTRPQEDFHCIYRC